jgi:hypothetical protein
MRPPTHDDPNAIPRNGTDVPWLDLDDPSHARVHPSRRHPDVTATATAGATASATDRQRRR